MRWETKPPVRWILAAALLPTALSLAPVGSVRGQEAREREAAEHAARASSAAQQRDFARAALEWRKVLELDPRSAQAYNNLGMVYYLDHKYPEAEQVLEKSLQLDPTLANARVLLGATLVRQGKMDRATGELERALQARLSDSAGRMGRVSLYQAWFARENYEKALEVLKPLAEKYPRDVDILYDLGQTYVELASQSFRQIARVDAGSYRIHQILADALAKQGRYREAILEYRQALEQKPDLPGIHYQIGLLYLTYEATPGGLSAALREFDAELKNNPCDAWSEYRLGKTYWRRHDLENAASHFRRALELDQTLVPAHVWLARLLEIRGDLDGAQKQLEAAGKFEPENPSVHYRLAELLKKLGQENEAAAEMKKFDEIQAARQAAQTQLEQVLRKTAELDTETPDEQDQ